MNSQNQSKFLNKEISTPLGLLLIILFALLIGGVVIWQYLKVSKTLAPIFTPPSEITPSPKPDEIANWKIFIDNEAGYSLRYPPELKEEKIEVKELRENIIRSITSEVSAAGLPPKRWKFKSDFLILNITRGKISEITDDYPFPFPPGYTRKMILEDEESLKKGEFGHHPFFSLRESQKVVKIDDKIWGKKFTILSMFEVCDISFIRSLIFFKDGYAVKISLESVGGDRIISELPQYFTTYPPDCGNDLIWNYERGAQSQFYNDLVQGKIGSETEAGIWYHTFDEIISTIDVFDPLPPEN